MMAALKCSLDSLHTNTSPSSTRCVATQLAPELLDPIFADYLSSTSGVQSRGVIALVCRAWRDTAQKRLLEKMNTCKVAKFESLRPAVRQHVKELSLAATENKTGWSDRDIIELLKGLPELKVLNLHLFTAHLIRGDYRSLPSLDKLERLSLKSEHFNEGLHSYRQIISAAPNISYLSIEHSPKSDHQYYKLESRNLPKVNHPKLAQISLKGIRLVKDFVMLQLITEETLSHIDHLEFLPNDNDPVFNLASWNNSLFDTIGSNLKVLSVGSLRHLTAHTANIIAQILETCSSLESLKVQDHFDPEYIPATLSRLLYMLDPEVLLLEMEWRAQEDRSTWKGIQKVTFEAVDSLDVQILESLASQGIEVLTFGGAGDVPTM